MSKVFMHPLYNPVKDKSGNAYLRHFQSALENQHEVCHKKKEYGIISGLFNLRAKTFIFHWVELIPRKPYGIFQSFYFIFLILFLKIIGKHIVWVLHNKEAHVVDNKTDYFIGRMLMNWIALFSNKVITHAREGVTYFNEKYGRFNRGKCHYIPHPVYSKEIFSSDDIIWDYIIWGGISRYKNVTDFLDFFRSNPFFADKKLLICGRCNDSVYLQEIEELLCDNVTFDNRFISDDELIKYIRRSRVILFTYNLRSVLSSGALIYSLNFSKYIIGPKGGAFCDLEHVVSTYSKFEEIPYLDLEDNNIREKVEKYITENAWEDFGKKLKLVNAI